MGEMAKYKGERVKIGTCEMMYYLRYEDRNKVEALCNNVDPADSKGLFFRLPFPEEDGFGPGNYDDFQPFLDYEKATGNHYVNIHCRLDNSHPALTEGPNDPGRVHTTVPALGLMVNLTCWHGLDINESTHDIHFAWNGKRNPLALSYLKDTGSEIRVCVSCVACGKMWSFPYETIEGAILDPIMKERISKICSGYKAQLMESEVTAATI